LVLGEKVSEIHALKIAVLLELSVDPRNLGSKVVLRRALGVPVSVRCEHVRPERETVLIRQCNVVVEEEFARLAFKDFAEYNFAVIGEDADHHFREVLAFVVKCAVRVIERRDIVQADGTR
jgi:hypothetical protein